MTGLLEVQFMKRYNKTVLIRQKQMTPLKVTKTHELPDGRLGLTIMDCSPGMLSGDSYRIAFHVGNGCRVFASNQSFTRVHPSRPGECSRLEQQIVVEQDAFLEYAMEPTMLFHDAHFQSHTEVELKDGATLIFQDVLCPGRSSREEIFQYHRYSGKINVHWDGELIYANHLCVEPTAKIGHANVDHIANQSNIADSDSHHDAPQSLGLWGKHTHLGTWLLFSDQLNQHLVEKIRDQLADYDRLMSTKSGVSLTFKNGLAVIVLADHAWHITSLFDQLSKTFR